MTAHNQRTIVVFGAGPGIGRSVAAQFAKGGFDHIIILSRNKTRLQEDKNVISAAAQKQAVRVDTVVVDLSSEQSVEKALKQIDQLAQDVEVVYFNAARVEPSPLLETPVSVFEKDFRTTTTGLYLVARWAIPKLQAAKNSSHHVRPSFLVTTGPLHAHPLPDLFSLTVVKTAQRSLVECLRLKYGSDGIHIGMVQAAGPVSPDAKVLNPDNIAAKAWEFFEDDKYQNELEVMLVEE